MGAKHINFSGSVDISPLEYATQLHWYDIVQVLINAGALSVDTSKNEEVLHWVSILPKYEEWAVDGILRTGTGSESPARKCITALLVNRRSLLDAPDELGFTPIMIASYHHRDSVVKCLIEAHCEIDASTLPENDGRTALSLYSDNRLSHETDEILEWLCAAGADLDKGSSSGMTALHFAARNDVVGAATKLIHLGAKIEARTHFGLTPLHTAALYNSVRVGRLLLDQCAERLVEHWDGTLNEQAWRGLTPMAFAVSRCHNEFTKMLLQYEPDAIARPTTGDSVVHFAVSQSDTRMLDSLLLIKELATPNVLNRVNAHGMTALHLCAGNLCRYSHAIALVNAGADVNQLSNTRHSVLDIAIQTSEWVALQMKSNGFGKVRLLLLLIECRSNSGCK